MISPNRPHNSGMQLPVGVVTSHAAAVLAAPGKALHLPRSGGSRPAGVGAGPAGSRGAEVRQRSPRVLDAARARVVAYELLARRPWTRKELTERLRRRGAPAAVAAELVAELERSGYVDDRAFARGWAESRARQRALGRQRIAAELRAKGVERELIEAALRETFGEVSEEAQALEVARRRLPALLRREPRKAASRLRDHLLRRGFPSEVVTAVLRRCCGAEVPDPEPGS